MIGFKEVSADVPVVYEFDLTVNSKDRHHYLKVLSTDEKERLSRFKFLKDADAYLIGKFTTRSLIGKYLSISPADIEFSYSEHLKPHIKYPTTSMHFNLSHSYKKGMLIFSQKIEAGVDIEYIKATNDLDQIAERFFSHKEVSKYLSLSKADRVIGFFNCWTRKEAFIKAIGDGLSFPLDKFEVTLKPNEKARLVSTSFDPAEKDYWSLKSVQVSDSNYKAAFAIRQAIQEYKFSYLQPENLIYA